MSSNAASDFDSAAKLLEHLQANFPEEFFKEKDANRHRRGQPPDRHPRMVRKYIFRGECGDRPTTVSAWERLEGTSLDEEDKNQLNNLVGSIAQWLQDNCDLEDYDAYGLVQHLGLPTPYIDFTGDPKVAIAFAVGGPESSSKKTGRVCVLELPAAYSDGRGQVAELFEHPWCERAKRQVAYGYCSLPHKFDDLKSPKAKADHGVVGWFGFTIQPGDRVRFREKYVALLKTSTDPVAGLPRHQINCYVAENGKLRKRVARFCACHVPMVPFAARMDTLSDGQQEVKFEPPGEHLCWNEADEKKCSLRYWSKGFRKSLDRDYFSTPRPDSSGIWVHAATYHPSGKIDVNLLRGGD